MDKYEIRPGVKGDEEEMARIDLECFPEEPWSVESFYHDLAENPFALYILAEDPEAPKGESIMGYVGVWMIAGEGHITNVAVREKYRRAGVGNVLLRKCGRATRRPSACMSGTDSRSKAAARTITRTTGKMP